MSILYANAAALGFLPSTNGKAAKLGFLPSTNGKAAHAREQRQFTCYNLKTIVSALAKTDFCQWF